LSHLLAVLAELKPTPNRIAAQSKFVYMQEAIKTRKKKSKNKITMIVLRVANESIRNTNETEDSNKKRKEI